jgi:hypothetical protein
MILKVGVSHPSANTGEGGTYSAFSFLSVSSCFSANFFIKSSEDSEGVDFAAEFFVRRIDGAGADPLTLSLGREYSIGLV